MKTDARMVLSNFHKNIALTDDEYLNLLQNNAYSLYFFELNKIPKKIIESFFKSADPKLQQYLITTQAINLQSLFIKEKQIDPNFVLTRLFHIYYPLDEASLEYDRILPKIFDLTLSSIELIKLESILLGFLPQLKHSPVFQDYSEEHYQEFHNYFSNLIKSHPNYKSTTELILKNIGH